MNYVLNLNISNLHDNIQLSHGADDDSLEVNGARCYEILSVVREKLG